MLNALIVDDSLTIRKMLTSMLIDMEYNVVGAASNGQDAFELYSQFQPDFVTMDINMSGMSGIEALKKIRETYKDASIFMLTSRGDDKVVADSIKYGAKGYILKPLNKIKIEKAIENVFSSENKSVVLKEEDNLNAQNYESSIKDSLTDLYTVQYMHHTIQHLIEMHNRNEEFMVGLLIININNLDDILTKFGPLPKDVILTQAADEIRNNIRTTDFPIRLSNNEFAIFVLGDTINNMNIVAGKLKNVIESIKNKVAIEDTILNISVGMAIHKKDENLIAFIERADEAVVESVNTKIGIHMSSDN